jgi:hypothetical protein
MLHRSGYVDWPVILPNITISITLILILQSRPPTELTLDMAKVK